MKSDPTDELINEYRVELYRTRDSTFKAMFSAAGEYLALESPPCDMADKVSRRRSLTHLFESFQWVFRGWSFPEDEIIARDITGDGKLWAVYADDPTKPAYE